MDALESLRLRCDPRLDSVTAWKNSIKILHEGGRAKLLGPLTGAFDIVGATDGKRAGVNNGAVYPADPIGDSLKDVASLIRYNVGVKVATVDMGTWDMHANMGTVGSGWLHDNVTNLAKALAAFAQDLGPDLNRVTLITLSEFGRRVTENGSGGVDHGYGNAVLVLGGAINGGKVYGQWPGLTEDKLIDGDLAVTTDYRAILAEVLAKRMGVADFAKVFPGYQPSSLGLARV